MARTPPPPPASQPQPRNELLYYARLYAEQGFAVFPCGPRAKTPIISNGSLGATFDLDAIVEWWRLTPDANVAIATGERSRLAVVDIDPKNGGSLEAFAALFPDGQLPPTKMVQTGGGGWHFYFRLAQGQEVANSVSKLAPGIDIRGKGGYVIAPPSVHPDGPLYVWDRSTKLMTFLMFPDLLVELLARPVEGGLFSPSQTGVAPTDSMVVEGGRNDFLARTAGRLRRDGLNDVELYAALQAINQQRCNPPLDDDDVQRVARSVSRYLPGERNVLSAHAEREQRKVEWEQRRAERASRSRAESLGSTSHGVAPVPAGVLPDALRLEDQEREIVAAILAESERLPEGRDDGVTLLDEVSTLLRPEQFYDAQARCVYGALLDLAREASPLSLSLVDARLRGAEEYPGVEALRAWMTPTQRLDFDPYIAAVCQVVVEAARRRALLVFAQTLQADALSIATPGTGTGSSLEIIDRAGKALSSITDNAYAHERDLPVFLDEYVAQLARWRESSGGITGASTGLRVLDRVTNGFQPGELVVVGGRASMGKTAYALSCALFNSQHVCQPGERVGIVTLEMSGKALIHRLVGMLTNYTPVDIMTGLGVDDNVVYETLTAIDRLPLRLMDASSTVNLIGGVRGTITPEVVRQRVKAWLREQSLKLLIVDYLQMMRTPPGMQRANREQQVAEMCGQMKRLAQECDIPVLLLAQLSRATEQRGDRLPQMSDIRESGGVEQDADVILMIFRRGYYTDRGVTLNGDADPNLDSVYGPGVAEIKIEKNRNGPVGIYSAYFDKGSMRYYDWDPYQKVPTDYHGGVLRLPPPIQSNLVTPSLPPPQGSKGRPSDKPVFDRTSGEYRAAPLPYADPLDDDRTDRERQARDDRDDLEITEDTKDTEEDRDAE